MKFYVYLLTGLFFLSFAQESNAQRTARTGGSLMDQAVKCASYEYELEMRQKYPQLGSIEAFEARIAPYVQATKEALLEGRGGGVITIPIVFHVIHNGEAIGTNNNISATYIEAQIEQLNNDYRKIAGTSGDNSNPVGADTEVEFCPVVRDPQGNVLAEPGINRINRNDFGWTAPPYSTTYVENNIKGATVWDSQKYLNIWVANISGGILGYAQFPSNSGLPGLNTNEGPASTDGVVVTRTSVGSTTTPFPGGAPYNRGRTLTHEVGHWLGLRHIWGDGAGCAANGAAPNCSCSLDDFCDDTPNAGRANYGCPNAQTCGSADMKENYMDYTDDLCMNIFTIDQKARIQTVLQLSRPGLAINAVTACDPDALVAAIAVNASSACLGDAIQFTSNSSGNITTWEWNFGDGSPVSNDENPSHIFGSTGNFTVTLTVGDGVGTNSTTYDITITESGLVDHLNGGGLTIVDAVPYGATSGYISGTNSFNDEAKAEFFAEGTSGSVLGDVEFYFSSVQTSAANITFRVWDDNGGTPGVVLATKSVAKGSISTTGATIVNFGEIVLNGPFYVGFELPNLVGDNVVIKSNSDGETVPTTAWERWDGGDWYPFNDYTNSNTTWEADVSLAIKANIECVGSTSPDPPVAEFVASETEVCAGTPVQFTDASLNSPTSWSWNFGDGSPISNEQNPEHIYAEGGNYTVTLTASNDQGSDVETKSSYIVVRDFPSTFAAQASETEICRGESVDLTMANTFAGAYTWETSTGSVISNTSAATVTPTATTTYTAICDDGVCYVESDVTITVNQLPNVTLVNSSGTLTATSASSGAYQWFFNGGLISTITGNTYVATQSGTYQAVLTDNEGCVGESNALNVVISAVIDPVLDAALSVYPNPVNDWLTVTVSGLSFNGLGVRLVDVSGRDVLARSLTSPQTAIDMGSLNAGVYFLRLENADGGMTVRKVVKQ